MVSSGRRFDELFLATATRFPDRVFARRVTSTGDSSFTYAEAVVRIASVASAIAELGLRPGDRVLCYLEEILPSVEFMVASSVLGIEFVPYSPRFSGDAALKLCERANGRAIFTTVDSVEKLPPTGLPIVCLAPDGERAPSAPRGATVLDPARTGDTAAAAARLRSLASSRTANDPYFLLPTSGSTGEPKLFVRTHASFWGTDDGQNPFGLATEPIERILFCSGLTHALGQLVMALGLRFGAQFCVPERIEDAVALEDVRRLDPTFAFVAPRVVRALYRQHLAAGGAPDARFFGPSFRMLRTTGSRMDQDLLHAMANDGIDVGECYGSTETGLIAATPRGGFRPGFVGKVIGDVEARIDEDGEILARSPRTKRVAEAAKGQLSDVLTPEGFVRTGDLGELTPDGYLRIVGRKKDVFNAPDGTNIHVARIEEILERIPWVAQAILIGDARPYVTVLVSVAAPGASGSSGDADGFLRPEANAELYARAREDIARANAKLESLERVHRVLLFGARFPAELYSLTATGKPKRVRPKIEAVFAERIAFLYSDAARAVAVDAEPATSG